MTRIARSRFFGLTLAAAVLGLLAGAAPALAESRTHRLLKQAEHGSLRVRLNATLLLGELHEARAVPVLARVLKDERAALRAAAAASLAKIGATEAADALVGSLYDSEPAVRLEAARALGQLRVSGAVSPLARALGDADARVRTAAAQALASYRSAAVVAPLSRVLLRGETAPEVHQIAQSFFAAMRGKLPIDEHVGILLGHADKNERARAAKVLEQLGDRQAVPALVTALRDSEPFVRIMASQALRSLGDGRAVSALEAMLAQERNERVIRVARGALNHLTRQASVPASPRG